MGGMNDTTKQQLVATMSAQHGLVSLDQLRGLGVTRSDIQVAHRQRWLERVGPRVYGTPAAPPTLDWQRTFALLAAGPAVMLSHRCSAVLHEFDRFHFDIVEVTTPRGGRGRRLPFVVHTTKDLGPLDRVTVRGYPCTSGTRTIIDLAHLRITPFLLEAAIDSAVRLGLSAPLVIVERLAQLRGPGRWGARVLDRLLLDSGGHTMLERRFLQLVRSAGLSRPRTQVVHRRDGKTFARVDFLWDDVGVVVEVSGSKGHSSPAERARDAQRRNELQDIGRRVYEYTWGDVTQRVDYVTETLRSRLTT